MINLKVDAPLSLRYTPRPPQWRLEEDGAPGGTAAAVSAFPFVIGRAEDCRLILPDSDELRDTTSRWHCYITEKDGRRFITDGSYEPVPETGARKPSISGTFRNGRPVKGTEELLPGDLIAVGPWKFTVEERKHVSVDIDQVLERIQRGKRTVLKDGGRPSAAGYRNLYELLGQLGGFDDAGAALAHILAFAARRIPAAEVLAVLPDGAGGARLAWSKTGGRLTDFRHSAALLARLGADEPFVLERHIAEPTASQKAADITSALLVPLRGAGGRLGALYMDNRGLGAEFTEDDLHLAAALGSLVSLQLMAEKQVFLGRLEENLKQYFSSKVVRRLVREADAGRPPELGAAGRTAAILFVDIAGFSAFCRAHSPAEVSGLLNPYFKLMSDCIHEQGGYVDKFIGDAVMGVFEEGGTLVAGVGAQPCVIRAVRAAREMIGAWRGLREARRDPHLPLRAGIDAGTVVIGNVGFPGRMEYTAIGDAVNLASRLQKAAEPDGIAVTEATAITLRGEITCRDAGEREIKGFGPVKVVSIKEPV